MIEPLKRGSYGAIKQKIDELIAAFNALMRIRIVRGDPLTEDSITFSGGSMIIKLKGRERTTGVSGSASIFPLQPVKSGADKIKIRYGTVHGIVPTIGGTAITADINDPLNPEITVTASGKLYVKVDLAADTYEAENPVIAFAAAVPADVDRVSAHQELAGVTFADGAITAIAPVHKGSIDVASCAGVSNYWDLG